MLYFLTLLFYITTSSLTSAEAPFIYVVIPSYNNEKWCIKNIESVANQNYPHWKAVIINDCSTDKTGILIEQYVMQKRLSDKITVIHNAKRKGMLHNIYRAVQKAKPHWIVATVDGDDSLRGNEALSLIASVYKNDSKVWMTYGSWVSDPAGARQCNCRAFPQEIIKKNEFRNYPYISSQLRTFYAGLFQQIKKKDMQDDGKFFMAAGDVAFMIPMLEMARKDHFYYVTEPIYTYNVENPINDFRVNTAIRDDCSRKIRSKKRYKALKTDSFKKLKQAHINS